MKNSPMNSCWFYSYGLKGFALFTLHTEFSRPFAFCDLNFDSCRWVVSSRPDGENAAASTQQAWIWSVSIH